jgi:hypothetical protein
MVRILQETTSQAGYTFEPAQDGLVANNIFYFERGSIRADVNVGPNAAPETFEFRNNLWYAHDQPGQSAPVLPVPEAGGIAGEDPRLGPSQEISPESPAFMAGAPVGLSSDLVGACYRSPPSIGAREGDW